MMEAEAKERQKAAGEKWGRGRAKKLTESIPEANSEAGDRHSRETNTVLAKASGTNRKYIEAADRIATEHSSLIERITKPLGGRPVRSCPRHDSPAQAEPTTQPAGQQRTLKGNAA